MRNVLMRLAEPLALLTVALGLAWVAHTLVVPVRVAGWSMGPTLCPGDIVLVRLGAKPVVGDIVLVHAAGHGPVLHRVVELLDGGAVRTKGDANDVADAQPAKPSEVSGRSVAVIPIGAWIDRWRGQSAYATMASQPNSTRR